MNVPLMGAVCVVSSLEAEPMTMRQIDVIKRPSIPEHLFLAIDPMAHLILSGMTAVFANLPCSHGTTLEKSCI